MGEEGDQGEKEREERVKFFSLVSPFSITLSPSKISYSIEYSLWLSTSYSIVRDESVGVETKTSLI